METKNIYQRLHAAMEQVGYVQKEAKKPGLQYSFASHDGVTAAVRPALLANGIVPTVSVKQHSQDGNRTEVLLTVRFVNIDKPDDFVEADAFGYGIDPQDKGPGKAISYAFKYCLLKTLCLETGDDPERDQIPHVTAQQTKHAHLDAAVAEAIRLNESGDEVGAFGELYEVAMGGDVEAQLYVWGKLGRKGDKGSTPGSRLRSTLKRMTEQERSMSRMNPTAEELASQG